MAVVSIVLFIKTATNISSWGDQQTLLNLVLLLLRSTVDQTIPFLEVITLLVPAEATATNNPSLGDQHIVDHVLESLTYVLRLVQV